MRRFGIKWASGACVRLLLAALAVANCAWPAAAAEAAGALETSAPVSFDEESARLLGDVCGQAAGKVPIFTSPSQVRRLLAEHARQKAAAAAAAAAAAGGDAGGHPPSCAPELDGAFEELGALLEPQMLEDICSTQMYDLIRAYHTKFIHFYLPEMTRDELLAAQREQHAISADAADSPHALKPIPHALRDFFVLFAKQIDAACKQHLVSYMMRELEDTGDELAGERAHLPNAEDFAVLERYKRESKRLGFLYTLTKLDMSSYGRSTGTFNKLQILDLIGARVQGGQLDEGAKLYVQVRFDDRLKRIKAACELRFMPVYLDLFAPVIRLNNLGYIERARSRVEDKELDRNEGLRRWFDIIQACEVLKDIEVLHDSSAISAIVSIIQDHSHLGSSHADKRAQLRQVKILSPTEAAELRRKQEGSAGEQDEHVRPLYDPELVEFPHQKVAFTPRMWLTQRKEVDRELAYFDRDVDKFVWQRTSLARAWRKDLTMQLKNFFDTNMNQIAERDESNSVYQLAAFFERHRLLMGGVSLCMSIIFVTTMLAG